MAEVITGYEEALAAANHDLMTNPDCTCEKIPAPRLARFCGEQTGEQKYCDSCNEIAKRVTYTR